MGPELRTGAAVTASRPRRRWVVASVVIRVVLVVGAVVGYRWWQEDETFCGRARALPDITGSLTRTGKPSAGLESSAAQLDRIAALAPDPTTQQAAITLATAQRAVAAALQGDPTNAQAVSAIAAAATPQVAAAQSQLQSTIAASCH